MWRHPSLHPLSHQHQHGLALTVLIDRGLRDQPGPGKTAELADKVQRMAEIELKGHFQVEEEVLFPSVRSALDSAEIIDELISQHRELQGLVERLSAAPEQERSGILTEFGQLLARHIRLEERELFEQIQKQLSEDQIEALGREIDAQVQRVCPVLDKLPWEQQ